MDPAWIALIGTLFGGAAFKIIEHFLNKAQTRDQTAIQIRTELRVDVTVLRKQLDDTQGEVDKWRSCYYELVSAVAGGDLDKARSKIRERRNAP